MNFTRLPRRGYVTSPTPIEPLHNLSAALGAGVNLYIKRDDLLPGCGGGNKTRKLDFCIADALSQGADTIITCGAIQSNHCRLTLSWAVKEGLDCHLVLQERVEGSYSENASGNNFLFQLMGAKSLTVIPKDASMPETMERLAARLKDEGRRPYIVPGGASNAIGATGYVACAQEIVEQINAMRLDIHTVVLPTGSSGTQAGMLVGMYGTHAQIPVVGINVSRPEAVQKALVQGMCEQTAAHLALDTVVPDSAIVCRDDYIGPGYSIATEGMIEAVKLMAHKEAILLDPVYSGKAMAGCIDLISARIFPQGKQCAFPAYRRVSGALCLS